MKNMIRAISSLLLVICLSVQAFAADTDRLFPYEIGILPYEPIKGFLEDVPLWQEMSKEQFIDIGLEYLRIDGNLKERAYLSKLYEKLRPSETVVEEKQEVKVPYLNEAVKKEREQRKRMVGRWVIPSLGVDVATFHSMEQSVVDASDSAAMFVFGDMKVIADHWNQGFEVIKKCTVGTKAYFDTGDKKTEYICTRSFSGHNQKTDMTDDNYNSVLYGCNTDGITCYTCNGNWKNIWIVFFQPVE